MLLVQIIKHYVRSRNPPTSGVPAQVSLQSSSDMYPRYLAEIIVTISNGLAETILIEGFVDLLRSTSLMIHAEFD